MIPGPSFPESAPPAGTPAAPVTATGRQQGASASAAIVRTRPAVAHLAGLDGLRAIAVMSVVFYHLNLSGFFAGGFLGVDIFFTLSGFLITSLLLREVDARGRIDLKAFYWRRFWRLAPAVLAVIAVCALLVQVVAEDAAPQLRKDIPAAVFYVSNWWQIVSEQSYFEMMSRPPLLQHLWSLAIEEQFYVLWPLLLMAVVGRFGRRGLLWLALALTLLTAGAMALRAVLGDIPLETDPNRLYLGTDTHTTGLFAGALLAGLWNPWQAAAVAPLSGRLTRAIDALGALGLAALLLLFVYANETQDWLYRGGFLLVAALTVAVIVSATRSGSAIARLLGTRPMRYMGERSYGLYLWHWPVFVLLRPQDLVLAPVVTDLLRVALTFLVAELSFRYVEDPLRRGGLLAWSRPRQLALLLGIAVAAGAVTSLYVRGYTNPLPATTPDYLGEQQAGGATVRPAAVTNAMLGQTPVSPCTAPDCPGPAAETAFSGALTGPVDMLAIGDSVLLGARHYFLRGLPGARVDAQVGRQGRDALRIVRTLRASDRLPATVLIHLGTNGYLPESLFRKLLVELADRERVILVNVSASRRWVADNNGMLTELSRLQPNILLVDWAALADGHPDYFVADGIHLSGKGIRAYVGAIRHASGVTGAFLAASQVKDALPVATAAGALPAAGAVTPLSVPADTPTDANVSPAAATTDAPAVPAGAGSTPMDAAAGLPQADNDGAQADKGGAGQADLGPDTAATIPGVTPGATAAAPAAPGTVAPQPSGGGGDADAAGAP